MRADLGVEPPMVTMRWLVRERATGAPVQWWAVMIDPGDPTFHLWVRTHPRLPGPVRDEVAAAGFSLLLHWVREHASDGQQGSASSPDAPPAATRATGICRVRGSATSAPSGRWSVT